MSINTGIANEILSVVEDAERTIRQGRQVAKDIAKLLRGKLRQANVDGDTLDAFKAELANFDSRSKTWKR